MKKFPLLVLTLLIALGCAVTALIQARSRAELQAQLARSNEAAAQRAAELSLLQAEQQKARSQSEAFQAESEELRKLLAVKGAPVAAVAAVSSEGGAKAAEAKGDEGNFMKKVAKMYDDPAMKKVMRTQQMVGIKMMYADMGKELGLSAEDAGQVMELLADRQMALSSKGMAMMSSEGGISEEAGKSVAASKDEYDAQIKGLIGEERMKKLTEYETGMGDRMQMQQVQQALTSSGMPLDEKQRTGLLGIMKEERLKTPPNAFSPGNADPTAQIKAMKTGEGVDQFVKTTEEMNQRVSGRARSVLTPDQLNSFEASQKQQLDMIKMGMQLMKQK